jgi:diguanylate cyclase (GGDEF)-like protein
MVDKVSRYASKLQRDANFDYLSGLLNRRAFQIIAQQSIAASHRYNRQLSLIMLDIDFFKRINDSYGHEVGDSAIKHVSNILKAESRESDCVARIGGEEFVLLLPDTDRDGAEKLANKLRIKVSESPLVAINDEIEITLSGGVASVRLEDKNIETALSDADEALYRAKRNGRNQVQLA